MALASAWMLVFLVPLRHMHRLFGVMGGPGTGHAAAPMTDPVLNRARAVARRAGQVADRLPWHSTCLVRVVALRLLLARRGIGGAVIRFGVRKQEQSLQAHAWLILRGVILIGGEEAGTYVPLADLRPSAGTSGLGQDGHGETGGQ